MSQAGIGRVATQIGSSYAQGFSLQNLGPGTIYLGSDTSVTPTNPEWILGAQASITWAPNKPLYAVSNTGATLIYMPGLDGASAQSVTATLADGSSVAVSGGSVGISGTATVAGTVKNQALNQPVLIGTKTITYAANTGGQKVIYNLGDLVIDTSSYASLLVETLCVASGDYIGMFPLNYTAVTISQYNQGGLQTGEYDYCEWSLASTIQQTYQVPVKRNRASFIVNTNIGTPNATESWTITFNVYGSNEIIDQKRYNNDANSSVVTYGYLAQAGQVATSYTASAASGSQVTQLASKNGPAVHHMYRNGSSAGQARSLLQCLTSGVQTNLSNLVDPAGSASAGAGQYQELFLPCFPLQLNQSNITAITSLISTVTAN